MSDAQIALVVIGIVLVFSIIWTIAVLKVVAAHRRRLNDQMMSFEDFKRERERSIKRGARR